MKHAIPAIALCFLLVGCGTIGPIKGRFVGADGAGISNAEVVCWQHALKPLNLPLRVVETKTDADGRFQVEAKRRVTFITAELWIPEEKRTRTGSVTTFFGSGSEVTIHEEPIQ